MIIDWSGWLRYWRSLAKRDRRALLVLVAALALMASWTLGVLPARERLQSAMDTLRLERSIEHQLAAWTPAHTLPPVALEPSQLAEQARQAGLLMERFDLAAEQLRLVVSGSPQAVAAWLQQLHESGLPLESLVLEHNGERFELHLEINRSPG